MKMKRKHILRDRKLQALKRLQLFRNLGDRDLEAVGRIADRVIVRPGRRLATQGEVATHLSIILEGTAAVAIDGQQLAVLGAGAYVGEVAFIEGGRATATVTAIEPTSIWHIARAGLLPIWQSNPQLAQVLCRDLAAKLRATNQLIGACDMAAPLSMPAGFGPPYAAANEA